MQALLPRGIAAMWLLGPACLDALDSGSIWKNVYCKPGFMSINQDCFDSGAVGKYQEIEQGGLRVRHVEYGASCVRTCLAVNSKRTERLHYFEAQLQGGLPPDPRHYGFELPNGTWIEYIGDGSKAASIGIVAGDGTSCFTDSTMPDDSFMFYQSGIVKWPMNDNLQDNKLSRLRRSELNKYNRIRSGERLGVIIDLHAEKLGFTRNGSLIHEYTRSLADVVPPLSLRFVVGGLRLNTTWSIVPEPVARQTLENMNWTSWTLDPEPEEPLPDPEKLIIPHLDEEELKSYRAFEKEYDEREKREGTSYVTN